MLDDARAQLTALLAEAAAAGGRSADAYCDAVVFHPMAAGKQLSALAGLCAAGLLSVRALAEAATPVVAALAVSRVGGPAGDGCAWGLGFTWRDLPADEPYLITSALVTRGLHAVLPLAPGVAGLRALADEALDGLTRWCRTWRARTPGGDELPAYSRGLRRPIANAAAAALAAIADLDAGTREQAHAALRAIWAGRIPGVGWAYEQGNPVVDLVHQGYLIDAMAAVAPAATLDEERLAVLAGFTHGDRWIDSIRLRDDCGAWNGNHWLRRQGDRWLELIDKPARLWSLGEALALLARRAAGPGGEPWMRLATRTARELLRRLADPAEPERRFLRHTMHVAHGLTAFIAAKRQLAAAAR